MAKSLYIRTVQAGRYVKAVRYTRAQPGDSKRVRQAKQAATNTAQKFINIKNSTERLEFLLCANFSRKGYSCFCTFTFRPDCLPANQKHTQAIFSGFLRNLRKQLRSEDGMKYIYTVEGIPLAECSCAAVVDDQLWEKTPWREKERWEMLGCNAQHFPQATEPRLHVHCFLNLSKGDYEAVRALWTYGQVFISPIKVNDISSFSRLASYVTKEKRSEKKPNGSRAYISSKNLEQPVISGHWCDEHEGLVLPQGAEAISRGSEYNDVYGSSVEWLHYRLPRPQQPPRPYKSKGRIGKLPAKKHRSEQRQSGQ